MIYASSIKCQPNGICGCVEICCQVVLKRACQGLNQPDHQDQSRCQLFFFSYAPILDLTEDTWQEYLAPQAHGRNRHHQGEFANSEDRAFSCWVRPRISVCPCLPNLPPACWVGVFLNLPPGHKSSQLIWYVVFPDNSALNLFVYISTCSVHPSSCGWMCLVLNVLNSSFNSIHQTFNMQWATGRQDTLVVSIFSVLMA